MSKQDIGVKDGMVGEKAAGVFEMTGEIDGLQGFVSQSADLAFDFSASELARRGGMGMIDSCGIVNGYSYWNTPTKDLKDCFPPVGENLAGLMNTRLNMILGNLWVENTQPGMRNPLPYVDLRRRFDISVIQEGEHNRVIGTTSQPAGVGFDLHGFEKPGLGAFYPSFSVLEPDVLHEFEMLRQGAEEILKTCRMASDARQCARDKSRTFTGMNWKAEPCAGDLAPSDERIALFCALGKNQYLKGTPEYRFALHLVPEQPLAIISFFGNNLPVSGKPTEKGGFGLKTGESIAYKGLVKAPNQDGLKLTLCFSPSNCKEIPTSLWKVSLDKQSVEVEGTMIPPVSTPFVFSLRAEQNGMIEETAGIDVVEG